METKKRSRVIITTKTKNYDGHFGGFSTITEHLDWDVCRFLIKSFFNEIFLSADESFQSALREFKITDPDTDEVIPIDFSNSNFINNNEFIKQIVYSQDSFSQFIGLVESSSFLQTVLLQNADGSIWIVPTINDDYKDENVDYVESLINWSENESVDLYLLLHDKDIYATRDSIKHHRVTNGESSLSPRISEEMKLKALILDGRVYVFIHNSDEDSYCKNIVNDRHLYDHSIEDIIDHMTYIAKNCRFSEHLGEKISTDDINSLLNNSDEKYDFSKKFI